MTVSKRTNKYVETDLNSLKKTHDIKQIDIKNKYKPVLP